MIDLDLDLSDPGLCFWTIRTARNRCLYNNNCCTLNGNGKTEATAADAEQTIEKMERKTIISRDAQPLLQYYIIKYNGTSVPNNNNAIVHICFGPVAG